MAAYGIFKGGENSGEKLPLKATMIKPEKMTIISN